jgi:predicted transcriptional regulator
MLLDRNNLPYTIQAMTKEQLIKLAGSQTELAKLLGISQPAVSAWVEVPQARIWQLKVLRPEWFML